MKSLKYTAMRLLRFCNAIVSIRNRGNVISRSDCIQEFNSWKGDIESMNPLKKKNKKKNPCEFKQWRTVCFHPQLPHLCCYITEAEEDHKLVGFLSKMRHVLFNYQPNTHSQPRKTNVYTNVFSPQYMCQGLFNENRHDGT